MFETARFVPLATNLTYFGVNLNSRLAGIKFKSRPTWRFVVAWRHREMTRRYTDITHRYTEIAHSHPRYLTDRTPSLMS